MRIYQHDSLIPYRKVQDSFPHGHRAAYIDRAEDGFFQFFRVPVCGGDPEQVTSDPTHKTRPAWSPLGDRIAFTVFSYRDPSWRIHPLSPAR